MGAMVQSRANGRARSTISPSTRAAATRWSLATPRAFKALPASVCTSNSRARPFTSFTLIISA